jgi:hypothetical protein
MTARSIFKRGGDRHECSNFSHPAYPIGTPRHENEKNHSHENAFADSRAMHNPASAAM